MRPALVRLVDLGFDDDFDASMSFAQSIIQSLVANSDGRPRAEVEFIRTRSQETVTSALRAEAAVLHIMGHGDADRTTIGDADGKSTVSLTELAEGFHADGFGIAVGTVFADCCSSAQGRFVKAVRACIEDQTTYIGAKRSVDWHESTAFASAFYAALFKDRGMGLTPAERGLAAAERAIEGYKVIVDGPCPFKVSTLTPARSARRAFSAQ